MKDYKWLFVSIMANLFLFGIVIILCTMVRDNKDKASALYEENTKLYYENMHYLNEIKRLNELIEFHKQLNGMQ